MGTRTGRPTGPGSCSRRIGDGNLELYVMEADGFKVIRLTDDSVYEGAAISWC